jgi:hypothetical protein
MEKWATYDQKYGNIRLLHETKLYQRAAHKLGNIFLQLDPQERVSRLL